MVRYLLLGIISLLIIYNSWNYFFDETPVILLNLDGKHGGSNLFINVLCFSFLAGILLSMGIPFVKSTKKYILGTVFGISLSAALMWIIIWFSFLSSINIR